MWFLFFACNPSEKSIVSAINDSAESIEDIEDSADTDVTSSGRPEELLGFFIDNARYPRAVCNDGSTPILYYRPGIDSDTDKWVIWFEGGGSCSTQENCVERWTNDRALMTTCSGVDCEDFEIDATKNKSGILAATPEENPHFHTWNHVMLNYCSSDFWLGNRDSPIAFGTVDVYFRGHDIAESMFSTLLGESLIEGAPSLADAREIVIGGSSAGAIGMRSHIDHFVERLSFAEVRAFSDAGIVPLISEQALGMINTLNQQRMQVWDGFVDQSCKANHPDTEHNCIRGAFLVENNEIQTPIYYHQDQADTKGYGANAMTAPPYSEELKQSVHQASREFFSTHIDAAYVPRKGHHIILATTRFHDASLLDDISIADTFWSWYQGTGTLHMEPED